MSSAQSRSRSRSHALCPTSHTHSYMNRHIILHTAVTTASLFRWHHCRWSWSRLCVCENVSELVPCWLETVRVWGVSCQWLLTIDLLVITTYSSLHPVSFILSLSISHTHTIIELCCFSSTSNSNGAPLKYFAKSIEKWSKMFLEVKVIQIE